MTYGTIGINFRGAGEQHPLGSNTEGGKNKSGPLGFLASNTHLATRNPKLRTEIEPKSGENLFFGLHLNLGANSGLK